MKAEEGIVRRNTLITSLPTLNQTRTTQRDCIVPSQSTPMKGAARKRTMSIPHQTSGRRDWSWRKWSLTVRALVLKRGSLESGFKKTPSSYRKDLCKNNKSCFLRFQFTPSRRKVDTISLAPLWRPKVVSQEFGGCDLFARWEVLRLHSVWPRFKLRCWLNVV